MIRYVLALVICVAGPVRAEDGQRIVSIGGAVTEIVYALGQQDRLVARDTTSNHPAAALDLPNVGYIRRLSPEGVLSVNPDLILSEEGAGPPEAVEILRAADIPMVVIPDGFTPEGVSAKITAVAQALGVPEKGRALRDQVAQKLQQAQALVPAQGQKKVLFILSLNGGRIVAAGQNTSADGIIKLAGGLNAASGFEGFKPMTDEAVLSSGAEVILMMQGRGDHATSDDDLFAHPAISALPAAQNRNVVRMDGMLLLGFSVRTPQAVLDLTDALYGTAG